MAGTSRGWVKRLEHAANMAHVGLYRRSDGRWANRVANLPVLLITTFGRKTGNPTSNAVVYIEEGAGYLVAATAGGSDREPDWCRNLRARPEATIEIGGTTLHVNAEFAVGDERARLYAKFAAASSNFLKYEQKTERELPVIRLVPAERPW